VTPALLLAYLANLALAVLAWRMARVRLYALAALLLDLLCLPLLYLPQSIPIYALDGLLVMAGPVLLAIALRVPASPVVVLGLCAVSFAMGKVCVAEQTATEGIYVAAHLVAALYLTIAPIASKEWRRSSDIGSWVLVGLAITGATGAIVVIAWGEWGLVNAGNTLTHLLLGLFAFFASRRDKVG